MADTDVFRITTYELDGDDFVGATYHVKLNQALVVNYFVLMAGGSDASNPGPSENHVRVLADPFGSGDLDYSSGDDILVVARLGATAGTSWKGSITVVESLGDHDVHGFRLRSVEVTAVSAPGLTGVQTTADTSATAWTRLAQVVLFSGIRGGGVTGASATATHHDGDYFRAVPSSTATITLTRYVTNTALVDAATVVTYVVEWGKAWKVQRVTSSGSNGGDGVNATGEYDATTITEVTRAKTWVWACGYTESTTVINSAGAVAVTLGDGVNQNTTETSVAVGIEGAAIAKTFEVYVMSHADLVVDYVFKADGDGSVTTYTHTVDAATDPNGETYAESSTFDVNVTDGERIGLVYATNGSATNAHGLAYWSARHKTSTTLYSTRPGQTADTWAAWVQSVDFAGIQYPTFTTADTNRSIRVTSYDVEISGGEYALHLKADLKANYFVMIYGGVDATALDSANLFGVRVAADPFGTGDLDAVNATDEIVLIRETAATAEFEPVDPWHGVVVVVEALGDTERSSFKLLDVQVTTLASFAGSGTQTATDTSGTAWDDSTRVVLFGGARGGGASITDDADGGPTDLAACFVRCRPSGTATLNFERRAFTPNTVPAAKVCTYVVQWGAEWMVQRVNVTGSNGGAGADATGEYNTATIESVTRSQTWVWACGWANSHATDLGAHSTIVALGDGVTELASETSVAVGGEASGSTRDWDVYVMTHTGAVVDWVFANGAAPGATSVTATVTANSGTEEYVTPTGIEAYTKGSRFGLAYHGTQSTADGDITEALWRVRHETSTTLVARRAATGSSHAIWFQSVDLYGVTYQSERASINGPAQYLVFPDPVFTGSANVDSVTSEGGATPGRCVPATTNQGNAQAIGEGDPTSTAVDLDLYVVKTGTATGIGSSTYSRDYAEVLWRRDVTDGDTSWIGYDMPYIWRGNDDPSSGASPGYGTSSCFSTKYQRVLLFRVSTATTVGIYYRDADAAITSWTSTQVTGENFVTASHRAATAACELPDGSVLLGVVASDGRTTPVWYDVQLWRSTDGGLTWLKINDGVFNATSTSPLDSSGVYLKMAAAGNWARLILGRTGTGTGVTLDDFASPDGGLSWRKIGTVTATRHLSVTTTDWSTAPLELVGIDAFGTFRLLRRKSSDVTKVESLFAAREDAFVLDSAFDLTTTGAGEVKAVWFGTSQDRHFVWVASEVTNTWRVDGFYYPRGLAAVSGAASSLGDLASHKNAVKYWPRQPSVVWAGHHFVFWSSLYDPDDTADGNAENGTSVYVTGGWSRAPLALALNDRVTDNATGQNVKPRWQAWMGRPTDNTGTVWTVTNSAASTVWLADNVEINSDAPHSGSVNYYEYSDGAVADSGSWADPESTGTTFEFVAYVAAGADTSQDEAAVRVRTFHSGAANILDFSVRVSTTTVLLYDNVAAASVGSSTTNPPTDTDGTEFRATIWYDTAGAAWKINLKWKRLDTTVHTAWTTLGPFTLAGSGGHAAQLIRFGLQSTTSASEVKSHWKEVQVTTGSQATTFYTSAWGQRSDVVNPTEIRGARLSRYSMLLQTGMWVRWGGTAAVQADTYDYNVEYSYGTENLSVDSPRYVWRSGATAAGGAATDANSIVFAASTSHTGPKVRVEAIVLVGTEDRTATFAMNTSDSWGAPPVSVSMNANLLDGLRVVRVNGNVVQVSADSGYRLPYRGETIGKRVAITVSGTTYTYRVRHQDERDVIVCDTDAVDSSIAADSTVIVFGDRMVHRFDEPQEYTYMRVTFASGTNYVGAHQLANVVPGFVVDLDPPLDWTHRDNEQPNNSSQRAVGGIRTDYVEGNPQRTLEGRIVGDAKSDEPLRLVLRDFLREVCDYSVRPIVLVVDDARATQTAVYGRMESGSQLDNAGWREDDDGVWRPVGDVPFLFVEEG